MSEPLRITINGKHYLGTYITRQACECDQNGVKTYTLHVSMVDDTFRTQLENAQKLQQAGVEIPASHYRKVLGIPIPVDPGELSADVGNAGTWEGDTFIPSMPQHYDDRGPVDPAHPRPSWNDYAPKTPAAIALNDAKKGEIVKVMVNDPASFFGQSIAAAKAMVKHQEAVAKMTPKERFDLMYTCKPVDTFTEVLDHARREYTFTGEVMPTNPLPMVPPDPAFRSMLSHVIKMIRGRTDKRDAEASAAVANVMEMKKDPVIAAMVGPKPATLQAALRGELGPVVEYDVLRQTVNGMPEELLMNMGIPNGGTQAARRLVDALPDGNEWKEELQRVASEVTDKELETLVGEIGAIGCTGDPGVEGPPGSDEPAVSWRDRPPLL